MEKWEGRTDHMYLDTVGKVTCGVGFLLTPETLQYYRWSPDLASAQRDYVELQSLPAGRAASWYRPHTRARMLDIDQVLARKLDAIRRLLPPGLPPAAVEALTDIVYNTGSLKRWPKLVAAIKARNWYTAAIESFRPQVSAARNKYVADLLLSCQVEA